ncbi:hypothetical protein D3C71_1695030 [compost metagenome]
MGNGFEALLLVQVLADQDVDGITDGVQSREDDDGHGQHHQEGLGDAAQQPDNHAGTSSYGGSGEACHSWPSSSGSL